MRRITLALAPLLLLACDREPVAPDVDAAAEFSATSEWITWEIALPPGGANFGIATCLGQEVHAFGGVSVQSRWVTRPDGSVMQMWRAEPWDTYHFVIGGEKWWVVAWVRQGVIHYDASGAIVGDQGNGAQLTLRNEVTGALLYWDDHWRFHTDANGNVRVDHVLLNCRVRG